MVSPVIPEARSDDRKAAALPTSSMVTLRRIEVFEATCLSNPLNPLTPAAARVLMRPAEIALKPLLLLELVDLEDYLNTWLQRLRFVVMSPLKMLVMLQLFCLQI
jgi:hypothetical protein